MHLSHSLEAPPQPEDIRHPERMRKTQEVVGVSETRRDLESDRPGFKSYLSLDFPRNRP